CDWLVRLAADTTYDSSSCLRAFVIGFRVFVFSWRYKRKAGLKGPPYKRLVVAGYSPRSPVRGASASSGSTKYSISLSRSSSSSVGCGGAGGGGGSSGGIRTCL